MEAEIKRIRERLANWDYDSITRRDIRLLLDENDRLNDEIKKFSNRMVQHGNKVTIYEDDGVTPWLVFKERL